MEHPGDGQGASSHYPGLFRPGWDLCQKIARHVQGIYLFSDWMTRLVEETDPISLISTVRGGAMPAAGSSSRRPPEPEAAGAVAFSAGRVKETVEPSPDVVYPGRIAVPRLTGT